MIVLDNLSVMLGGKTIVDGVTLDTPAGSFSAIVGPSGSGKTTLLRSLAGELPYLGSVKIAGKEVSGLTASQQAALRGVLPQASYVAFPFTVREVVMLNGAASSHEGGRAEQERLLTELLSRVGLKDFAGRRYAELSGGEMQRVQLARVLFQIGDPNPQHSAKWLLLDEPVSSLDIRHQNQILQLAAQFAEAGGGVVAIMHDLNLTANFADQVFMMNSGRLIAHGPARECMTSGNVSRVFECGLTGGRPPTGDVPFILPHSAQLS